MARLDRGFGDGGSVTVQYVAGDDILRQPDGRIIVVGVGDGIPGLGDAYAVARRYMADGQLDLTFGHAGLAAIHVTDPLLVLGFGHAAFGPNGRIYVAGVALNVQTSRSDGLVVAFTPNGTAATGFSDDGWERLDFARSDWLDGIAVTPDGRVIVAGASSPTDAALNKADPTDVAVAVLGSDGTPDPDLRDRWPGDHPHHPRRRLRGGHRPAAAWRPLHGGGYGGR